MKKGKRTFKLLVKEKESGQVLTFIMGDNYKDFEDHFLDFCNRYTKKWEYESEYQYAKCYGRNMKIEFIDLFSAPERFVGFGGLKWTTEENYDEELKQHNKNCPPYKKCPTTISEIHFTNDRPFLDKLKKECRVYK